MAKSFYLEFQRQSVRRLTSNPDNACLFVAILDFGKNFKHLNYFIQNGRNHLFIDLGGELRPNDVQAAMLISSKSDRNLRLKFLLFEVLSKMEFSINRKCKVNLMDSSIFLLV